MTGGLLAALCCSALSLAGVTSAADAADVELSEEENGLRVWSAELEGRIVESSSHCAGDVCDLLLVVAPSGDDEDDEEDADGGVAEGRGGDEVDERSRREIGDRADTPPALLHLRLDSGGGLLRVVSARLPVGEDEPIALFDVTAPGAMPRAALRLGEALRLVPYRSEDRDASRQLVEPLIRVDEGLEARALPPGSGRIGLFEPGHLELIELEAEGTDARAVRARHRLDLPFDVSRRGRTLTLESPPIHAVGDPPAIAVGPQGSGSVRLRTLVLAPGATEEPREEGVPPSDGSDPAADAAGAPEELWSALPGPETVHDSEVLEVAGRRYLVVSTTRADRLGVLERKKLRLWELSSDRTRAGAPPLAEIRTASRHWQRLRWSLLDATSDGVLDLVLLQPEGLSGRKLAVDLYEGRAGGGFARKKVRSMVEDTPPIWRYGRDATGDGVPDLVLARNGGLEVHAGRARPDRRGLLDEQPRSRWSSSARVSGEVEDDSVRRDVAPCGELLLFTRRVRGRTALEVVALPTSAATAVSAVP